MQVQSWASNGLLVRCSLPGGGAPDQTATLRIARGDGQAVTTSVPFKAQLVGSYLTKDDFSSIMLAAGSSTSLNLGGGLASWTWDASTGCFSVVHTLPPTGLNVLGNDTFISRPLANGFKVSALSCSVVSPQGGKVMGLLGTPPRTSWELRPPLCNDVLTDDLLAQCRLEYKLMVEVVGPLGLWYK
jgi:hypothetical protein